MAPPNQPMECTKKVENTAKPWMCGSPRNTKKRPKKTKVRLTKLMKIYSELTAYQRPHAHLMIHKKYHSLTMTKQA